MKGKMTLDQLEANKRAVLAELTKVHALERVVESRIIKGMTPVVDRSGQSLTRETIKRRIKSLARDLMNSGKDRPILISVMDGALPFAAELQAELATQNYGFQYETIQVSSYAGTTSGELSITSSLKIPVGGKDIIVVDDVCDTGKTYDALRLLLLELGATSVQLMVLVDKTQERATLESNPTYAGFTVSPDAFVAGWGMDYEGLLRNYVIDIGAVDPTTLPTKEEAALLQSKKPLNSRLQECLALETELRAERQAASQSPLQKDSFCLDCLVAFALAGGGSAVIVYGLLTDHPRMWAISTPIVVGGMAGMYSQGFFSSDRINKMTSQLSLLSQEEPAPASVL